MSGLKTSAEVGGMGHSVKRKEDARFIRGQGKYTDDVVLPGMLHGHSKKPLCLCKNQKYQYRQSNGYSRGSRSYNR